MVAIKRYLAFKGYKWWCLWTKKEEEKKKKRKLYELKSLKDLLYTYKTSLIWSEDILLWNQRTVLGQLIN